MQQARREACTNSMDLQYIARNDNLLFVSRRVYPTKVQINGRQLENVVIDPHYEEKHGDSISDDIILELVKLLDGKSFKPIDEDEDGFQYFVNDRLELAGRFYKLIWLLHEKELFVGIVNAYRR
jgi:hypothetical protein